MGILTARKFLHILLFSNRDVEKKQSFKIYALLFVHKYMLNPIGGFFPEGDPITAEADDEGNWEATVPELTEGDTVTVVAESEGKDPSAPITVSVNGLTVAAPTATITGNSTDGYPVTGTAAANAAIEILNEAGDIVGSTTADDKGAYTVTLDPDDVAPEEALQVVAVVTAGGQDYRSTGTTLVVPADDVEGLTETPTIDSVTAGDTTIGGTAEPGATVTVTLPDGTEVTTETDDEGNWSVNVPELSEGDTITVVADSDGKDPSDPINVTVGALTVAAPTASISGNSTDGYPVIGKASAHAIIEILNEDNEIVGKGTVNHAGNFMITLNPENVTAGDILRVVAIVRVGGKDYRSQATKIVVPNDESDGITPNGNNLNENNKDENNKFLPKTGTENYWYISILGLVLFLFGNVLWYLELKRRRKES